jgi:hypothetical protein
VPAATVEIEREVDDATALVRATARFSLRSSAFSALLECKMQGCAPWSRGFQARPLCSPQGDTFQNARLAYDAGDSRPAHDIDGVPAVTQAIDLLNMPSMTIMVCVCTASRRASCVLAVSQIPILLVAQRLEHSFFSLHCKRRASCSSVSYRSDILYRRQSDEGVHALLRLTPESAQPYETAYLAASGKMMPAATASLAELQYALLPSLSMLEAAEAATGCSMRA